MRKDSSERDLLAPIQPIYGAVFTSDYYHVDPNCRVLKQSLRGGHRLNVKYQGAAPAIDAGHTHPCPECGKMLRFTLKIDGRFKHVCMTNGQLTLLRRMFSRIDYKHRKLVDLHEVTGYKKSAYWTLLNPVDALCRLGLLNKIRVEENGRNFYQFTQLGVAVLYMHDRSMHDILISRPKQDDVKPYDRLT